MVANCPPRCPLHVDASQADWVLSLAEGLRRLKRDLSAIGCPVLARGVPATREASLDPLDLVSRNADREMQTRLFVAPAHDLGVFVEPVKSQPIGRVERQFDQRPAASQAAL